MEGARKFQAETEGVRRLQAGIKGARQLQAAMETARRFQAEMEGVGSSKLRSNRGFFMGPSARSGYPCTALDWKTERRRSEFCKESAVQRYPYL